MTLPLALLKEQLAVVLSWWGLGLSSSSYEKARWTHGFMWFRLPRSNIVRPHECCCIAVSMVLFKPGVELICSYCLPDLLWSKAGVVT
jgi:hypothetical protein